MNEYMQFSEEFLRNFYDPATCSYMVPLSGKAAHDMGVLREENATLKAEGTRLKVTITTFQAESAKLREMVQDMLLLCIGYPHPCIKLSVLVERARKLGVEVVL